MKKFLVIAAAALYAAFQIALITAKLAGLQVSWYWIFAPIWAPVAAVVVGVIVLIAFLGREQSAGRNPFL